MSFDIKIFVTIPVKDLPKYLDGKNISEEESKDALFHLIYVPGILQRNERKIFLVPHLPNTSVYTDMYQISLLFDVFAQKTQEYLKN